MNKPKIFLRHDIDVALGKAAEMAEMEQEFGIRATYMILVNSPVYSIETLSSKSIILEIASMGHEIGLHFIPAKTKPVNFSLLSRNRKSLPKVTRNYSIPVKSFSFHLPRNIF